MSLPLYLPVAGLGCAVPRILIVDNREDIRLALAILMEDEGHAAFEGVDGRDVLPLVRKHHPDLILLDLMTPDTDAPEALSRPTVVGSDVLAYPALAD